MAQVTTQCIGRPSSAPEPSQRETVAQHALLALPRSCIARPTANSHTDNLILVHLAVHYTSTPAATCSWTNIQTSNGCISRTVDALLL